MKALLVQDTLINKDSLIEFKEANLSIFPITSDYETYEHNKEIVKGFSYYTELDSSVLINNQINSFYILHRYMGIGMFFSKPTSLISSHNNHIGFFYFNWI